MDFEVRRTKEDLQGHLERNLGVLSFAQLDEFVQYNLYNTNFGLKGSNCRYYLNRDNFGVNVTLQSADGVWLGHCHPTMVSHYGWETKKPDVTHVQCYTLRDICEYTNGILAYELAMNKRLVNALIRRGYDPCGIFSEFSDSLHTDKEVPSSFKKDRRDRTESYFPYFVRLKFPFEK